jgi:RNA polymerase sigma-70 factor, ECF subfamily
MPAPETLPAELVPLDDAAFKTQLAATIPHLRAYGRSLTGDVDRADDLVQDTMLKAWTSRARFAAGTSMKAWTFVILRNAFLSQMRRQKFHGEYDAVAAEKLLVAAPLQEEATHVADIQRAMLELSADQREALILVGAGGMSYEEAAQICDVAVGTMKSRVSRARTALEAILSSGRLSTARADMPPLREAMGAIMARVDSLTAQGAERAAADLPEPD